MRKVIALVLWVAIAIGGYVLLSNRTQPVAHESPAVSPESTSAVKPQKQVVKLTLPGADPIEARVEDYTDPNSLWVVVNKQYPLTNQQYRPDDLVFLEAASRIDKSKDERSLRSVLVNDFNQLIADAKKQGFDLIIGSGFRSYALQQVYYGNYVAASGEAAANKFSAKPGQSEHQTGLAFDIALRSRQCYLDVCFGDTPAGQWIAKHAQEYGFIVRYPADKTDVTQYQYEPWHLRYVGEDLANALKTSGLVLDEAYPYLQKAHSQLQSLHQLP